MGHNCNLKLNGSAAALLMALAGQESDRHCWIDAICLSQQAIDEKNERIPALNHAGMG